MDHKTAEQVRKKMEAAFAKIPGLKFQIGHGTYNELTVSFKVTATDDASDRPLEEVQAEKYFEKYAHLYGLKPDDLGKQFVLNGERYQVIGIDAKRRKFPIVLKSLKTDTTAAYTSAAVKLCLKHPEDETAREKEHKNARAKEAEADFKLFATLLTNSYGITQSDLGASFKSGNGTFTIVGAQYKKGGIRIVGEKDSKKFVFEPDVVAEALGRKAA